MDVVADQAKTWYVYTSWEFVKNPKRFYGQNHYHPGDFFVSSLSQPKLVLTL